MVTHLSTDQTVHGQELNSQLLITCPTPYPNHYTTKSPVKRQFVQYFGAGNWTRSSATAERQRVSYARLFLGSPTDRALHWTPHLLYNYTNWGEGARSEAPFGCAYVIASLWLWSYLAPFLRCGDLLAKNCPFLLHFCYLSLIRRPRSLCSLWNFALKLTVRKLESWGYPPVKPAWS